MNQLIEIFQRIRLLDQPTQILNEYIDFFIKSSNISLACIYEENEVKFVFKSDSYPEEKLASLTQDLGLYLSDKLISKYITDKLKCANNLEDYYYCSFVPFKFGQKLLLVVFIFEDLDLLKDFAHQTAIILNEQLYLMINNLNLKELSYTDGLTRLRNNMFFRNKLDEAFIQNKPVHLALFDVDYFKKINDVYGHPGGDAVLVFLGEIVPKTINQLKPEVTDITIARVGGEEFAILIVDSTLDFMKIFAEELRKKVETSKVRFNDLDINLTISIGIASSGQISNSSAEKPKTLYKLADDALYIAKRTGRNRISLSHDSN
ncbi:MAG: hypothetical protein B7Y39_10965 [Bdellovibrio sp. 28-41-41]|nr:MAG: hypothetical protein B7Y39_10965 [Bdellovibrio sp. 28-41-41]